MKARLIVPARPSHRRRGAVSGAMEEILILSVMLPASWAFYEFVVWWCRVMFDVISPLVQWAYL